MADLVTMIDMTQPGLAFKHRADTLTTSIRGRHARAEAASKESIPLHLADILPLTIPYPPWT